MRAFLQECCGGSILAHNDLSRPNHTVPIPWFILPDVKVKARGPPCRNIVEDPRCSVVVQLPGWTGLANARVTIFGDVYQLPQEQQGIARQVTQMLPASSLLQLESGTLQVAVRIGVL